MKKINSRSLKISHAKNQSGFGLIEALIVLAISLVIVLFILTLNGTLTGYINAYRNAQLTQTNMQSIEQAWLGSPSYAGINTAAVAQPSLINNRYLSGSTITNVYNAPVDVSAGSANGLTNNLLMYTDHGVKRIGCTYLVSTLADGMDYLSVNGVVVKAVNGTLDSAATTAQCSAGSTTDVVSGKIKSN